MKKAGSLLKMSKKTWTRVSQKEKKKKKNSGNKTCKWAHGSCSTSSGRCGDISDMISGRCGDINDMISGRCRDINDTISGRCRWELPSTYTHTRHLHTPQALTHTPGTYTHFKRPKRKGWNGKDAACGEDAEQLEFPLELVEASVSTASLKNGLPNPSKTPYTPTLG